MAQDIIWMRIMLNKAETIRPDEYIDSKREVRRGERVLGEVGEETKQLFTLIQRFARNREELMGQVGMLMRDPTSIAQQKKWERLASAREVTWHIEILKVILLQHLQRTFRKKPDAWIEICKGFLAVHAMPPRRPVLRAVKAPWN